MTYVQKEQPFLNEQALNPGRLREKKIRIEGPNGSRSSLDAIAYLSQSSSRLNLPKNDALDKSKPPDDERYPEGVRVRLPSGSVKLSSTILMFCGTSTLTLQVRKREKEMINNNKFGLRNFYQF